MQRQEKQERRKSKKTETATLILALVVCSALVVPLPVAAQEPPGREEPTTETYVDRTPPSITVVWEGGNRDEIVGGTTLNATITVSDTAVWPWGLVDEDRLLVEWGDYNFNLDSPELTRKTDITGAVSEGQYEWRFQTSAVERSERVTFKVTAWDKASPTPNRAVWEKKVTVLKPPATSGGGGSGKSEPDPVADDRVGADGEAWPNYGASREKMDDYTWERLSREELIRADYIAANSRVDVRFDSKDWGWYVAYDGKYRDKWERATTQDRYGDVEGAHNRYYNRADSLTRAEEEDMLDMRHRWWHFFSFDQGKYEGWLDSGDFAAPAATGTWGGFWSRVFNGPKHSGTRASGWSLDSPGIGDGGEQATVNWLPSLVKESELEAFVDRHIAEAEE